MTTEALTKFIEAYGDRAGQHVRIGEIAQLSGLTAQEIHEVVEDLLNDEDFEAEMDWRRWSVTATDKAYAPVINGEPRELVRWR